MKSTFENEINKSGYIVYKHVGNSMYPLIKYSRDLLYIQKAPKRCNRLDVVLFKRKNGQYILHRIIKVNKKDYVITGDNQRTKEYGVTDSQIIGVLTKIIRDGKTIDVNDRKHKIYSHLWCDFFPIRAAILWIKAFPRRAVSKIKRTIKK